MSGHRTFHVLDALEASPARTRRIWSQTAKELILPRPMRRRNVSAVARGARCEREPGVRLAARYKEERAGCVDGRYDERKRGTGANF